MFPYGCRCSQRGGIDIQVWRSGAARYSECMTTTPPLRVLLTGASGEVGTALRHGLHGTFDLILTDLTPPPTCRRTKRTVRPTCRTPNRSGPPWRARRP